MKKLIAASTCVIALVACQMANALTFELGSCSATIEPGNTGSDFYNVTPGAEPPEEGSAAGMFSFTAGGSAETGFWVEISFNGNQPTLESAFLKAGNGNSGGGYLWWDAADLAGFNAGNYDAIKLWNSGECGMMNPTHRAYLGTSHAGLNGAPVPDGGMMLLLVGLAASGLGLIRKRQ